MESKIDKPLHNNVMVYSHPEEAHIELELFQKKLCDILGYLMMIFIKS